MTRDQMILFFCMRYSAFALSMQDFGIWQSDHSYEGDK